MCFLTRGGPFFLLPPLCLLPFALVTLRVPVVSALLPPPAGVVCTVRKFHFGPPRYAAHFMEDQWHMVTTVDVANLHHQGELDEAPVFWPGATSDCIH